MPKFALKAKSMAKLFINKDIAADSEKIQYWLSGDDCVSYTDIQSFLDVYADDPSIDIELHSCGGSCIEGYAIYDALRVSGKEISCTVVGTCASMATVILLAAPLERRAMYPNARLLIHNPHYPSLDGVATIETLSSALEGLQGEKERMMGIYMERTGKSREELEAQMATDSWFGSERAIELGFVSHVVPMASAKYNESSINVKEKSMKKQKPSVAEAFKMLGVALGITKAEAEENNEAVALTLTTSTGEELTVERDGGEIQVGDNASPDGNHVLEDGRTVVVQDGVITEIKEPAQEEESKASEEAEETEAKAGGEAEGAESSESSESNEENPLQVENESLKAQIVQLQGELEAFKAKAKSDEEARILAAVEKAGGEAWLTKAAASTYVPAGRSNDEPKPAEKVSLVEKRLTEARERNKKRYERKK